ncbi:hypothetical protein BKA57DRAFT_434315 [Linnemannia elongata]|nr:hypothetical protein BKA57DRAFT_434315 [Linnemannia elongata]
MTIAHREEEDSQTCLNIALDKGIRPLFLNLVSHFSHFPHFSHYRPHRPPYFQVANGGRYLSIVGKVAQGSQIGLAADPFDFRLENVADGTDKYRISPFSAASLTIQKSTCSEELVLQTSPGQGEDEWLFNMLK